MWLCPPSLWLGTGSSLMKNKYIKFKFKYKSINIKCVCVCVSVCVCVCVPSIDTPSRVTVFK